MATHLLMDWKIFNLQSMAGWADKLSVIQSSTVAKHHQILAECDAHLSALTQPCLGPAPTMTLPCKLSRLHGWKDFAEVPVPPSTQLKQKEIYVNAEKVHIWFWFWLSRHWISNSAIIALPITRFANKWLVPCVMCHAPKPDKSVCISLLALLLQSPRLRRGSGGSREEEDLSRC